MVLSPTRELALQIESEVKKFHYREIKRLVSEFFLVSYEGIRVQRLLSLFNFSLTSIIVTVTSVAIIREFWFPKWQFLGYGCIEENY